MKTGQFIDSPVYNHHRAVQCRTSGPSARTQASIRRTRSTCVVRSQSLVVGWPEEFSNSPAPRHDHTSIKTEILKTDVLGLGQAMVDFGASVPSSWLESRGVAKGSRKLVSVNERTEILEAMEDEYHLAAGGSLSNTLIDLSRMVEATTAHGDDRGRTVAMAGLVGNDTLGSFYKSQMESAGVSMVHHGPGEDVESVVNTGTVIVLTTEDAQRTMLSYLGTQKEVQITPALEKAIKNTNILVIEGYMWELPNASKTILSAIAIAKEHGVRVAMTAGDAGVVERHGDAMWESILAGIDILFTNADEAASLARSRPMHCRIHEDVHSIGPAATKAEAAALCLGPFCPMVCVTDGSAGSVIATLGQMWVIPPHWTQSPPVDTCGAGDAWAAGILYGLLHHQHGDIVSIGHIAARAASAVIAKHGPTLCHEAAASIMGIPIPKGTHVSQPGSTGAMHHMD